MLQRFLLLREASLFVLFRPSTDWMRPTHNLLSSKFTHIILSQRKTSFRLTHHINHHVLRMPIVKEKEPSRGHISVKKKNVVSHCTRPSTKAGSCLVEVSDTSGICLWAGNHSCPNSTGKKNKSHTIFAWNLENCLNCSP